MVERWCALWHRTILIRVFDRNELARVAYPSHDYLAPLSATPRFDEWFLESDEAPRAAGRQAV
jgi:hypothetical protein